MNLPASLAPAAADFMADHVFSRIDIPGWLARTGFQMLDPIKTAQSRVDFLRQLHDREALLPREQQRRFLASEGWIAWSGPAIAELLKQFIAHNRMMTGGFSIHGDLVTLVRHRLPRAGRRRRGRRHRPACLGARHQARRPAGRRLRIPHPRRAFRSCRRIEGGHADVADRRASGCKWLDGDGEHARGRRADGAAARRTQRKRCLVRVARGARRRRRDRDGLRPGPRRPPTQSWPPTSPRGHWPSRPYRTLPRLARLGQINDHTRISLGRIMSEQAARRPARASACCSTAACTPTKRWTAASTTSSAASSRSACGRARTSAC